MTVNVHQCFLGYAQDRGEDVLVGGLLLAGAAERHVQACSIGEVQGQRMQHRRQVLVPDLRGIMQERERPDLMVDALHRFLDFVDQ